MQNAFLFGRKWSWRYPGAEQHYPGLVTPVLGSSFCVLFGELSIFTSTQAQSLFMFSVLWLNNCMPWFLCIVSPTF